MTIQSSIQRLQMLKPGVVLTEDDIQDIQSILSQSATDHQAAPPLIKVRCGRKEASLNADDVISIKSTSGSSTLVTRTGENWCTHHSLKAIEVIWAGVFARLNRNTAIHRRCIHQVHSPKSGVYQLITTDGECLEVSRRCYSKLQRRMAR